MSKKDCTKIKKGNTLSQKHPLRSNSERGNTRNKLRLSNMFKIW